MEHAVARLNNSALGDIDQLAAHEVQESARNVGGGIGNEKENLLALVCKLVVSERYSIHAKKQTQILSAVLGNDAGIIGAALLDE